MWPALKPSDRASIVGAIDPVSTVVHCHQRLDRRGASSTPSSPSSASALLGASATVDAKLQQATDSSGTGVKDISGKAITQFTKVGTDDAKQTLINLKQDDLDVANSFNYFRLSITGGTAASLVTGYVLGMDPRYGPATDFDATTVDEVVG
jgi:hypothetical protein